MNRLEKLEQSALETSLRITASPEAWQAFLDSASWTYKYSFYDQISIYAQRPDATAVADMDTWNNRVGRMVKRGAKAIFLPVENNNRNVRYVFDYSDTAPSRRRSNLPGDIRLWQIDGHELAVQHRLGQIYGPESSLSEQIAQAVQMEVGNYFEANEQKIGEVSGNPSELFRLATMSACYLVEKRCGMDAELDASIEGITLLNSTSAFYALGCAIQLSSRTVLKHVERTVRQEERRQNQQAQHNYHGNRRDSVSQREAGRRTRGQVTGQVQIDEVKASEGEKQHGQQRVRVTGRELDLDHSEEDRRFLRDEILMGENGLLVSHIGAITEQFDRWATASEVGRYLGSVCQNRAQSADPADPNAVAFITNQTSIIYSYGGKSYDLAWWMAADDVYEMYRDGRYGFTPHPEPFLQSYVVSKSPEEYAARCATLDEAIEEYRSLPGTGKSLGIFRNISRSTGEVEECVLLERVSGKDVLFYNYLHREDGWDNPVVQEAMETLRAAFPNQTEIRQLRREEGIWPFITSPDVVARQVVDLLEESEIDTASAIIGGEQADTQLSGWMTRTLNGRAKAVEGAAYVQARQDGFWFHVTGSETEGILYSWDEMSMELQGHLRDLIESLAREPSEAQGIPAQETPASQKPELQYHASAVDAFLRTGGNAKNGVLRIIGYHQMQGEDFPGFLRREFCADGTRPGGRGLTIEDEQGDFPPRDYSVWYDKDGIRICEGRTAFGKTGTLVTWEQAAERVDVMLTQGIYQPRDTILSALSNERRECAAEIWFLHQDYNHRHNRPFDWHENVFDGGFDASVQRKAAMYNQPEIIQQDIDALKALQTACTGDSSLMRWTYHVRNIPELLERLERLKRTPMTYPSGEITTGKPEPFITEDEIDSFIQGNDAQRSLAHYSFFIHDHSREEQVEFLKKQYGNGGRSHSVSHADDSFTDYGNMGITFRRGKAEVRLKWSHYAIRLENLILSGRFPAPDMVKAMPDFLRTTVASHVASAYQMVAFANLPFAGNDIYNVRDMIVDRLEQPEEVQKLLDGISLNLSDPPEERSKERRQRRQKVLQRAYDDMIAYREGTLTLLVPDAEIAEKAAERGVTLPAWPDRKQAGTQVDLSQGMAAAEQTEQALPPDLSGQPITRQGDVLTIGSGDSYHQAEVTVTDEQWEQIQQELPSEADRFIDHFYVVEDLRKTGPLEITTYDTVQDALNAYFDLPMDKLKALGIQNTMPMPGSLDFLQCRYGIDTVITDSLHQPGWNHSEILAVRGQIETALQEHNRELGLMYSDDTVFRVVYDADGQPNLYSVIDDRTEDFVVIDNKVQAFPNREDAYRFAAEMETDLASARYLLERRKSETRYFWAKSPMRYQNPYAILDVQQKDYIHDIDGNLTTYASSREAAVAVRMLERLERTMEAVSPSTPKQPDNPGIATNEAQKEVTFPYHAGDTLYLEDGKPFVVEEIREHEVQLRDTTLIYPVFRVESRENLLRLVERHPQQEHQENNQVGQTADPVPQTDTKTIPETTPVQYDSFLLTIAKEKIQEYSLAEFGTEPDFSDLSNVPLAYSSTEDGLHEIQISADLESYQLFYRVDSKIVHQITCDDLKELVEYLGSLDFGAMIADAETAYYEAEQEQHQGTQAVSGQETQVQERDSSSENQFTYETVEVLPPERTKLPYTVEIQTIRVGEPIREQPVPESPAQDASSPAAGNFHITDEHLGEGKRSEKYQGNVNAIRTLKQIEAEERPATWEEQEILSRYVGWGGLADCFDQRRTQYAELKNLLTDSEFSAARASTLNAHYTSPTVIHAIYDAVERMGFRSGRILEPSMGVGNFFGLLPDNMAQSQLYGVELDSITGRIAQKLYPDAEITVAGFETTSRKDFFDLAIGNVPFGQYQVNDPAYNRLGFSIHNYFFAKSLEQVRPGGIIAFVTSRYTMDAKATDARRYIAQRAELLGAIRLPNNAFRANAGTDVVSDILFLQKRDRPLEIEPEWVFLGESENGFAINQYFVDHPEMVLGVAASESTQYGRQDYTVAPAEGAELSQQLREAIDRLPVGIFIPPQSHKRTAEQSDPEGILPPPDLPNQSFVLENGTLYFKECVGKLMQPYQCRETERQRILGMIQIRDAVRSLIQCQLDGGSDAQVEALQTELNRVYDLFVSRWGNISAQGNQRAFSKDSSIYLLSSLEEKKNNEIRKTAIFHKRTVRCIAPVTHCDTAQEALAVCLGECGHVDLLRITQLTGQTAEQAVSDLRGSIYPVPNEDRYVTADEYLSGNVREKLNIARSAAASEPDNPAWQDNVAALEQVQPKPLGAEEINVRLGSTWVPPEVVREFVLDLLRLGIWGGRNVNVNYNKSTGEWYLSGKGDMNNLYLSKKTYGTDRMNAPKIIEQTLNLKDVQVYDRIDTPDGERRVLNTEETIAARAKQELIQSKFKDWIFENPKRRTYLVSLYNERFNSYRNRTYDGSHLTFPGMNPEITLREHQLNAVARGLYGGNTLLAHVVGAGKTFEMTAIAMESKRLGLAHKSMIVVPNHLTGQWGIDFLRLYPAAKVLVATEKDFTTKNRKKFCTRIATGDWDVVIIGHSQFERIPLSLERQEAFLQEQIDAITDSIEELKLQRGENWTIKSMERTRKGLEARLQKLQDNAKKDTDNISFEALGIDRLFVDEAQAYKNGFIYTKMQNVAGISQTESQRAFDLYQKCRYLDEETGGRGVIFATGTPISNSITEMYIMQRYLQFDRLDEAGMGFFDAWASTFGEVTTTMELAPEGTGYRSRTRFAKFHNLPELMSMFQDVADIKTADELHLDVPVAHYETIVAQRTEIQARLVHELSERATKVHNKQVSPEQDNMLRITTDGRKVGLDQRLIDPSFPDEPGSKVNLAVGEVLKIWRDYAPAKGTQLVFCDFSAPTDPKKFNVYSDMKAKLIAAGVPEQEIAFIHDAKTKAAKEELFQKVQDGDVRILFGSTEKMGAGTNVQDRLVAIHDVDCPWRPGDLEQRAGRIVRQGNRNKEVYIKRYVTEATFDSYLYQTVENKQKFISQIMTSKTPVRSCEDVDESVLSYAEIKALCAGNPLIREKMELDTELTRMKVLRAAYKKEQYKIEDIVHTTLPNSIRETQTHISRVRQDETVLQSALKKKPQEEGAFLPVTIDGKVYDMRAEAGRALGDFMKRTHSTEPVPLGEWYGFSISICQVSLFQNDFYRAFVQGAASYTVELGETGSGDLKRIENAILKIPKVLEASENRLISLQGQLAEAKQNMGKPWPMEEEYQEKSARLKELEARLTLEEQSSGQKDAGKSAALETDEDCAHAPSFADRLLNAKAQADRANTVRGVQEQKKSVWTI